MEITRFFTQLSKADVLSAGGKGASLGEMTQAGIPVPPGFVVLTEAFDHFLTTSELHEEIQAELDTVNHHELETVERASEAIRGLILNSPLDAETSQAIQESFKELNAEFVAVRSSATAEDGANASWAGELDSFLNTTEVTLLENVRRCWASLFTPRAIFYRFENGFHTGKVSVAVVVQKMVQSEVSGIAFSVHPVTEDYNQLIIEAGFGLGEAIVSGSITPDNYVVDKRDWSLLDSYIAEQERGLFRLPEGGSEWQDIPFEKREVQKLAPEKVTELAQLVVRIEKHYGFPCDIEWAMENNQLFIVQSRPITTLTNSAGPQTPETPEKTADTDDPDPAHYQLAGEWVCPVIEAETWLDWTDSPDLHEFGLTPDHHFYPTFDGCFFMWKGSLNFHLLDQMAEEFRQGKYDLARKVIALSERLAEESRKIIAELPANLTFADFQQAFSFIKRIRLPWQLSFALGEAGEAVLQEYAQAHNLSLEELHTHIPVLPTAITDDQRQLSVFKAEIREKNLPFHLPEIERQDGELATRLKEYWQQTAYLGTHHFWGAERSQEEFMSLIEHANAEPTPPQYQEHELGPLLEMIAQATKWRLENAQSSDRLTFAFRPFLSNLAQQFGLTYDDIIFLTSTEIEKLINGELPNAAELTREREKAYGLYEINGEMQVVTGSELEKWMEKFGIAKHFSDIQEIKGMIGNAGYAKGRVAVLRRPSENPKLEAGMILVAPETTPDFVPAMSKAAAFVTDRGGITAHAAVIAREMNKPCIIGTTIATRTLKDGDLVEVDATHGIVRIIEAA